MASRGLGSSRVQDILDGKRTRRSFLLRSAFDNYLKSKLDWSTVCGGKKDFDAPEPMVEYDGRFRDFCKDCLGIEISDIQAKIGESVEKNEKTSVAACYASGKTFIAACLVLYWLFTRRPALVVTTAPTGRQVKGLLWREVRKLYKKCRRALKGRLLQTKLEFADDWQGFGFASDGANAVAGLHEASNVFFIIDEAAGVNQETYDGFDGITASQNSRVLLIGNPICQSGPFFDSHKHSVKSKLWEKISISALDTPNYLAGRTVFAGLVEKKWVEEKRLLWGENSPLWKMKVLGEFVELTNEKVIPEAWVAAAHARYKEAKKTGGISVAPGARRQLGVDVAGGGRDSTVFYLRHGHTLKHILTTSEGNHDKLFDMVKAAILEHDVEVVIIDATQIGKGLADRLAGAAAKGEIEVGVVRVFLNVGADDNNHFFDRRSEIKFLMRAWFDPAHPTPIHLDPDDAVLAEELSLLIWWINDRNLLQVESKTQMRKRLPGQGSPDNEDAANMTFVRREVCFA